MAMALKRRSQRRLNQTVTDILSRWITWTLFVLVVAAEDDGANRPEILQHKDVITLKVGQTLDLKCLGDEPVTWNYTISHENEMERLTLNHGMNNSAEKKYWATLNLKYVKHFDVGFYTCFYNSSFDDFEESEGGSRSQHIYLMTEDMDNLLVNPDRKILNFLTNAIQGLRYTIPCKPTSNLVDIELTKDDTPIDLNDSVYNKRDGYTINTVTLMSGGEYVCTGKLGSVTQTIHYHLIVGVGNNNPLPKPKINFLGGSVSVGTTFTLNCTVQHEPNSYYTLNWTKPASVLTSGRADIIPEWIGKHYQSRLVVHRAVKEDEGDYECTISTGKPKLTVVKTIRIYEEEERFLNVTTVAEEIKVRDHETAKWVINISSHPSERQISWMRGGKEITEAYYRITDRGSEVILEKNYARLEDAGSYQFIVEIPRFPELKKVLNLSLVVRSPPDVEIEPPERYFAADKTYELECLAFGYPIPTIQWYFKSCTNFENEGQNCSPSKPVAEDKMSLEKRENQKSLRSVNFTASEHAIYYCVASNSLGKNVTASKYVQVVDFPGQKSYGIIAPKRFIEGDNVNLTCGASKLNKTNAILWQRQIPPYAVWNNLTSSSNIPNLVLKETNGETKWSWQKTIQIENISTQDSGYYRCVVDTKEPDLIKLDVEKTQRPRITSTNLNESTVPLNEGDYPQFKLFCKAAGVPTPSILWFRNREPMEKWPTDFKYTLSKDNTTLTFDFIREAASGLYMCEASSRVGKAEASMFIEVNGPANKLHPLLIIFLVVIVLFLFVLLTCLAKKIKKERGLKNEINNLYRVEFEEGAVGDINPELGVEDQAILLPYDKKWEFPKDRIKLGMQLGSGAFGRVIKAEATGIRKNESLTEVAVKMVKANADESHIKALMSELKIMVHLGQHINVVNLLGACTKNLAKKRELLVIVEYCKYGSLLSYLHRHKQSFINQLDPVRDVVDANINTQEDFSNRQSQVPKLKYATLTFGDTGRKPTPNGYRTLEEIGTCPVTPSTPPPVYAPPSPEYNPSHSNSFSEGYATGGNMQSMCTDMSYVSNCPSIIDTEGKRRSSSGSTCVGHYRGDYQHREVTSMTTSDLLCWSFQIARGMEYLASRKVLHGDLAARNVLLAENNIVKICDFGLAKEMYKDYKYKKKSEGVLLPVKWMAIESIYFAEFSTQSDAWSFGVVLWEIFTLGKTPYPGMEADERFYKMLNDGYRMEKPPLAPSSIYDLMMNCWSHQASSRPTFTALSDRIGDLMHESQRQHYIDLNLNYDKSNKLRLQSNPDYLAQMGGPEFKVNDEENVGPVYANVQPDYFIPSHQQTSDTEYQNVQVDLENVEESKRLQPLAENAGYMFVNHSPSTDDDEPVHNTFSKAGIANNDGYSLGLPHFPPNSPGPPCDVFSPRPHNPKAGLEFNFADENINRDNGDVKNSSFPRKVFPNHSPPNNSPKEISGISNLNYIPNNTIFPHGIDVLMDINEKSTSPKRQKNDSGVSSIGSNFENKSPTPPIDRDSNCNSDILQNRNSYILAHENENQKAINV